VNLAGRACVGTAGCAAQALGCWLLFTGALFVGVVMILLALAAFWVALPERPRPRVQRERRRSL
jgi:hypothetical protein